MKTANGLLWKKTQLITTLIFCIISIPTLSKAQNQEDLEKVTLFVSCVEDLGDGRLIAYFGYDNQSDYTITVQKKRSYIAYNYTRDIKYLEDNTFEPGFHDKVFSQEFVSDDWVRWTVKFSNRVTKIVRADVDSERCVSDLPIIPYYTPPTGGKLSISLIGAELNSLYEKSVSEGDNFHPVSDDIFQINESLEVFIEVVAHNGKTNDLVGELNGLISGLSTSTDFLHFRATYWFPIRRLFELNGLTNLNYARPVFTGINDIIYGQGDVAMRSDYTRMGFLGLGDDPDNPFNLDGSGVRIGVISNSYDTKGTAHLDVDQEDLPGAKNDNGYTNEVAVLKDIITPTGFSLSDEGRAMMQIVHDVAPGAELVFRTGYLGELDMAQGIRDLANPNSTFPEAGNCDIIVDDITYITEPFFRDGIISKAINDVVKDNLVSYFSSAGNFSNYSYEDVFQGGSHLEGIVGEPHNFGGEGPEDLLQLIRLDAGDYTLALQWDDGTDPDLAVTNTDLDIFLTHDDGTTLFGFNRVNTGGAPVEVLPFTVLEDNVYTNIVITRAPDGPDYNYVPFKYVVFRGGSGFHFEEDGHDVGSSTIVGHANAEGTMAVGAVRYHHTPAYGKEIIVEDFSSMGGTSIMTHSLVNPDSEPIIRVKPDFTAPDGVNTSVNLSSEGGSDYVHDTDTDALPNFFGTSAAAPHAAGAAALIIHARRSFDNENNATPVAIRELMQSTAIGNENHDFVSGYGFIQPYAAIRTFANPKPEIDEIVYTGIAKPGETLDPISFTLEGNFYINEENPNEHTEIHIRGEELTSGVVIIDEQTIEVTHSFLGNPEIQAINPPTVNGGPVIDGGASDPIYFSITPKTDIIITARSFEKKYGETLPNFSMVILPDDSDADAYYNTSIDYDGFAAGEKERILERLSFNVRATVTSSADFPYDIKLEFAELDPDEELDHAIAEKYDIEFEQGHLLVHKLALKITPKPVTIGYGQELTQDLIDFDYVLGSDKITTEDLETVLADLKVKYTNPLPIGVPMVNGITLVRGTALVNNPDGDLVELVVDNDGDIKIYLYNGSDRVLYNGTVLPRGIALVNDLPFVQIEEIIDGIGLFGDDEVTFQREAGVSYMTHLDGDPILNEQDEPIRIALENSIALVRGIALVNGVEVEVTEINGETVTTVNGVSVGVRGIALVNGIPLVRGTALVNSKHIVRGTALVNEIEVPIMSGIPDVGPIENVYANNPRGIALVNGIALKDDEISIMDLDIVVSEGTIVENSIPDGTSLVNGIALVRGTALVNGQAIVRGIALVNGMTLVRGIALVNDAPTVDILDNLNFLASTNSLDYLNFVNGTPLVNGIVGVNGQQVAVASDPINNSFTSVRGIALVNGLALVRGTALVNNTPLVRGTALVNTETIKEDNNEGAIVINHEAEESSSYIPVTFITGTDAGTHSIIPGTFLSNNFNITYGVGILRINKAEIKVTAAIDASKTYGDNNPPEYNYNVELIKPEVTPNNNGLLGNDDWAGILVREIGEDVRWEEEYYRIGIGSLEAGSNYHLSNFIPGEFRINPKLLKVTATGNDKVYDGTTVASVELSSGDVILNDDLDFAYEAASFEDKNVGELKHIDVWGITIEGVKSFNYTANTTAEATAEITQAKLTVTADRNGKDSGEDDPPLTIESYLLYGVQVDPDFNGTVGDVVLYNGDYLTGSLSRELSEAVGSYEITKGSLSAGSNYNLTVTPGTLFYINPYGPGTRAVKPVLNCVRDMGKGVFEANFSYSNENDSPVFIPVGPDNLIMGSGLDEDYLRSVQPELFLPGGPQEEIKIIFDGDQLSWSISSRDDEKKASNAANANSNSTKCKNNQKSAAISQIVEEKELDPDYLNAYPNPVTDKLHITMKDIEHYKTIMMYDIAGNSHSITSIDKRSDKLEIDMAQLPAGYYFIKIVMEDSSRMIQVIKQ